MCEMESKSAKTIEQPNSGTGKFAPAIHVSIISIILQPFRRSNSIEHNRNSSSSSSKKRNTRNLAHRFDRVVRRIFISQAHERIYAKKRNHFGFVLANALVFLSDFVLNRVFHDHSPCVHTWDVASITTTTRDTELTVPHKFMRSAAIVAQMMCKGSYLAFDVVVVFIVERYYLLVRTQLIIIIIDSFSSETNMRTMFFFFFHLVSAPFSTAPPPLPLPPSSTLLPSSAKLKHHDLPVVFIIVWKIHLTKFTLTLYVPHEMARQARQSANLSFHWRERAPVILHSPSVKFNLTANFSFRLY